MFSSSPSTRFFQVETVLTLLTGIAFESGLGDAKDLIGFMTGEPASELTFLDTSTKGRVFLCRQKLVEDIPALKAFYPLEGLTQDWQAVLLSAKNMIGEEIEVQRFDPYPTP